MTDDGRSSDTRDGAHRLSLDTVFEVLADQRRRFTLYSLSGAPNGVVDFSTLTEDVATLEACLQESPITGDRLRDVAADLRHWHLPVLADVGIIDYDERSETIRYLGASTLEAWLHRIRNDELS